jgi:CPA2 family monovalent cation:H+ antiporter-2
MLFNPSVVITHPWPLLATVVIILVGKFSVSLALLHMARRKGETAFTVAASLAQIGEFSFILSGLGLALGVLPQQGRDLILAAAIVSIVANPLLVSFAVRFAKAKHGPNASLTTVTAENAISNLTGHAVLVGFGRVGATVAAGLAKSGVSILVIENSDDALAEAQKAGFATIVGNAADPSILRQANLSNAVSLIVAIPNAFEAGQIVEQSHRANATLLVLARAHTDQEVQYLLERGADVAILGEYELARGILDRLTAPSSLKS